ncbi:MAG: hypothetical protein HN368_18795 [Spirochaetales bacterium]|jgi:hypothetical protein|nr:hypothetical protein [Spirochaetales bacterium]
MYQKKSLVQFGLVGLLAVMLISCPNPLSTDLAAEEDANFEIAHRGRRPPVVENEFFPKSRSTRYALRSFLGWEFTPLAKSEDGRIVVGNAVNTEGYTYRETTIEPGTTVGVFWIVGRSWRGRDPWISSPRVVGVFDYNSLTGSRRTKYRIRRYMYSKMGLFYLDKYSIYLHSAGGIGFDADTSEYKVAGLIDSADHEATIKSYKVTGIVPLAPLSDEMEMFSFDFPAALNAALENDTFGTIVEGPGVDLTVPGGTNVSALVPVITISDKAEVSPASEVPVDFTGEVTYIVTAEDGSSQEYLVNVSIDATTASIPPEVSFPPHDLWIQNAGTDLVNGYYDNAGLGTLGKYYFDQADSGSYHVFFFSDTSGTDALHWGIDEVIPLLQADRDLIAYYNPAPSDYPEQDGWSAGIGDDSLLPVVYSLPLIGDRTTISSVLEIVYEFYDPDIGGYEGNTEYYWYRCTSATDEGALIDLSPDLPTESKTYTTTTADNGSYLRVLVVPVDDTGTYGTGAKSPGVLISFDS